jgi:LCP family protein required for cell wall assembly
MNNDRLRRGAALVFATILAGTAFLGVNAPRPAQAADLVASFTPADSLRLLGKDGRFTILLLGSDARPRLSGLRTDAILVVSVDPVSGKAAIVSIPRDTAYFPLAPLRTGKFSGRINALYSWIQRYYPKRNPGTQLRLIIGKAIGVEIDAYAILGFDGFRKLVNNVGGLDVYVATKVCDWSYWMTATQRGVCFPRGPNHVKDLRALAFARIRHTPGGDYSRARRQQQLIVAAQRKVNARTVAALASLLLAGKGLYKTDLPPLGTWGPLIFAMAARADAAHARKAVFQPSTFAYGISGYRIVMKIAPVRSWVTTYFPPKHYNGTWLPPEPTPTPTPTPEPTPTPTPAPTPEPTPTP